MVYTQFDFKHGRTILERHYAEIYGELREVLDAFDHPLGRGVKPTASKTLQSAFEKRGWIREQQVSTSARRFAYDLAKDRIAVEVQLNDSADCYNDYLKFLLGYNEGTVEVGVEIVYDSAMTGDAFHNVLTIGQVHSDLVTYRRVLPCPMWIIGLWRDARRAPTQWNDIA